MSTSTDSQSRTGRRGFRSAASVHTMLVAALAASAAVGMYSYGVNSAEETPEPMATGETSTSTTTVTTAQQVAPFTTADVGMCATWDVNDDGQVSGFEQTSCEGEHRFEISNRENLAT